MMTSRTRMPEGGTLEDLEIDLLLEGIRRRYGCDLQGYDRRYIRQRVRARLREEKMRSASQLLERILRRPASFSAFVNPGEEPHPQILRPIRFWRSIRQRALPPLRTYASVRAWLAGGSSESDLLSLLLLLDEELARPHQVYASGLGGRDDRGAAFGSVRAEALERLSRPYRASGGRRALGDQFESQGSRRILCSRLRERAVFAPHNIATDASFNTFHLIVVRGSFFRGARPPDPRRFGLLDESLIRFGFLVSGPEGVPEGALEAGGYRMIDAQSGLYQKVCG